MQFEFDISKDKMLALKNAKTEILAANTRLEAIWDALDAETLERRNNSKEKAITTASKILENQENQNVQEQVKLSPGNLEIKPEIKLEIKLVLLWTN